MKKILLSLLTVALVSSSAVGATQAYFSDTETSTGNTFAAGSLDLAVDENNGLNTVKFTVANMRPGNQPKATYTLNNVGSLNGYLDLENISVSSNENGCLEPETDAGDANCDNPGLGQGELQDVVNMRLFLDGDCNGWIGTGETVFYNGDTGSVASNYELDEQINAGDHVCVTALFDWWSTVDDNKAMGDDMTVNMTFELAQTVDQ
jgi:predicted ribosomally synthesized peptide with SipW-like signal peptide